jgi:hypothetical protein
MQAEDEGLRAALTARCRAVIDADVSYLEGILTPSFRHVHGSGKIEPRADYLKAIEDRRGEFRVIDPRDLTIDTWDGSAVISGDIYIERNVDGAVVGNTSRFASVWRRENGAWRMGYWQMTGIK